MGFLSMEPSKKSSKYIIFSARRVSHCQDESRLNAKALVNCACVVGLYSQSNTFAICVKHTKIWLYYGMFSIAELYDVGLEEGSLLCKLHAHQHYVYGPQGSIRNFRGNIKWALASILFDPHERAFV